MIEEVISLKDLVTESATRMREGVAKLSEGVTDMKEKMASASEGSEGMGASLMAVVGPVGVAIAAVAALSAALGGLVLAGMDVALEQAELKEKLLATFSALGGGEEAGKATLGMLNELSEKLPQSRDQLGQWTKQFQAMGVTDLNALRGQITATASAQAIFGDEGAASYTRIAQKIKDAADAHQPLKLATRQLASLGGVSGTIMQSAAKKMGVSVTTLAAQLKSGTVNAGKFGAALQEAMTEQGQKPLDAMAGSLVSLGTKLKENIGRLFEDIDVKPVTDALRGFFDIFSQSQPSGQAMKAGIVPVFNKIFQFVGKLITGMKHLALDMVILGLKAYIALKPIIRTIGELWERFQVGQRLMIGLKMGLTVVAAAIMLAVGPILLMVAAGAALWTGLVSLGALIADFVPKAFAALSEWAQIGATLAGQFIDGLIAGITGGVGKAVDAVKSLGSDVMNGIKGVLGIHSPSRVMIAMGGHVAGGFAAGIHEGTGHVGRQAQRMGYAANDNAIAATAYAGTSAPAPRAPMMQAQSGRTGATVNVEPGAIVIHGAGKGAEELTEEAVSLLFERVALAQGA